MFLSTAEYSNIGISDRQAESPSFNDYTFLLQGILANPIAAQFFLEFNEKEDHDQIAHGLRVDAFRRVMALRFLENLPPGISLDTSAFISGSDVLHDIGRIAMADNELDAVAKAKPEKYGITVPNDPGVQKDNRPDWLIIDYLTHPFLSVYYGFVLVELGIMTEQELSQYINAMGAHHETPLWTPKPPYPRYNRDGNGKEYENKRINPQERLTVNMFRYLADFSVGAYLELRQYKQGAMPPTKYFKLLNAMLTDDLLIHMAKDLKINLLELPIEAFRNMLVNAAFQACEQFGRIPNGSHIKFPAVRKADLPVKVEEMPGLIHARFGAVIEKRRSGLEVLYYQKKFVDPLREL